MTKNDYAGTYAEKRLSTSRDDRCNRSKLNEDARLRGRLGTNTANKIIKAIDEIKMHR